MTAIARLPGCGGQAADAVSAYTQVKNGRCTIVIKKIPKSECPDIWIRPPKHKSRMEDPIVPLERNLYGHPLTGLNGKVLLEHGWEKFEIGNMLVCKTRKKTILVCVCGRHKTGWEETKH